MEDQITSYLEMKHHEMNDFIRNFFNLVEQYEYNCFKNQQKPNNKIISSWINQLKTKIINNRQKKDILNERENAEDKNLFDTLTLLISQVDSADKNINLIENSTMKLNLLSHNTKSLERELFLTQQAINNSKESEREELKRIWFGFLFFSLVVVYVVSSRLGIFKISSFLGMYSFRAIRYFFSSSIGRDEL